MGMPSERQAIWDVVLSCAIRRRDGKCNCKFNSVECNDCKWNIYNYINAAPNKVNLLMIQADNEAASLDRAISYGNRVIAALVALIVVLIVGPIWLFISQSSPPSTASVSTAPVAEARYSNAEQDIENTLCKVTTDLKKKKDVNKDGLINCIDAALLFYKYYPDKNKVRIYLNYNPAKDFNHLFNSIISKFFPCYIIIKN